jgi:hypothetical protein
MFHLSLIKIKIIEILTSVIMPLNSFQEITYRFEVNYKYVPTKVNYLFFTIFLIIRLWYILRYFLYISYYQSGRAQRFSQIYNIDISLMFVLKCIVKKKPLFYILTFFTITTVIGSLIIQIWERIGIIMPNYSFDNYFDCLWFVFGTIVTLGYGDYRVTSLIGRITSLILSTFGAMMIGMTILFLQSNLEFKDGHLKSFVNLNQVENLINQKEINSKIIVCMLRAFRIKKLIEKAKEKNNKNEIKKLEYQKKNYEIKYIKFLHYRKEVIK